jgi:hypothetical protein
MKLNRSLSATVLTVLVVMLLGSSCGKNLPGIFNPLTGGCQVAAFHSSQFDAFFPTPPPYFFQKTFDATGRIVTGIDCSFSNDIVPLTLPSFLLHLTIVQKGWMVLLIRKPTGKEGDVPDTLGRIYLNSAGRPDSCVGAAGLDPFASARPVKEIYYYKKDRLLAIYDAAFFSPGGWFGNTDTIHYDSHGNPVSFLNNSYQYDYHRSAKQQYYSDDFMEGDRVFYLLQYLGFFPEVTNPPNVRTRAANTDNPEGVNLTNLTFDAEGKLIGYDFVTGTNTITWNCR